MPILEVDNISIRFGGVKALSGVSFSVEKGEFVGLMGPNGAGKTTAINCISKIYPYETGTVKIDGEDIAPLSSHDICSRGVSRTFQDLGFFERIADMTVLDYLKIGQFALESGKIVADGLKTRRSQREQIELTRRARRMLEFFREMRESFEPPEEERGYPVLYGREGFPDLVDFENSPIRTLSFAWRRRVDLARALVSRPKILLLDEPAQGLAPSEMTNLGKVLEKVSETFGVSALIVEHNVGMLMAISDRIICMSEGKVLESGDPATVAASKKVAEIYLGTGEKSATTVESIERKKEEVPILEVKNLDVFYGHAQALSSVSLSLYPRQVACVLGTNGSGKSTLLRAISGLEKPTFGEIFLKGEPLPLGWPEIAVERGIQYVPQGHVIFPNLTVLENLKVGAYSYEKRGLKADLERPLHYFPDLKKFIKSQANDLSGGQQQMLAMAQALVGKPEILLLDEPSLGLSPKFTALLFEIIQKIAAEERCSILLIEQNVAKSLEICDFVFMLNSGVVLSSGHSRHYSDNLDLVKKNLGFY